MPLMTLADAKLQLNITSSTHDVELQSYVDAVEAVVEEITGKVASEKAFTEELAGFAGRSCLFLANKPVKEIVSITDVAPGTTVYNLANVHVNGPDGEISGVYFSDRFIITYHAGMTTIPPNYNLAARIILQHIWLTQRGDSGNVSMGGLDYPGQPGGGLKVFGFSVPNAALDLLGSRGVVVS